MKIFVPIFKYDGHDVWVAIQSNAVDGQRRQQSQVSGSSRHFTNTLVRLVVAVVATGQRVSGVVQYEEALGKALDTVRHVICDCDFGVNFDLNIIEVRDNYQQSAIALSVLS